MNELLAIGGTFGVLYFYVPVEKQELVLILSAIWFVGGVVIMKLKA